jgi:hypothetical protein
MTQSESFSSSLYTDQMHLAERELSAFIAAVAELFGADQARISVKDWLDESELMDVSPRSTRRDCRAITIAASVRLANRLNVALHRQSSLGTSTTGTEVSPIPSSNCFPSKVLL